MRTADASGLENLDRQLEHIRHALPGVKQVIRGALDTRRHRELPGVIRVVGKTKNAEGVLARGYVRTGMQEIYIYGAIKPDAVKTALEHAVLEAVAPESAKRKVEPAAQTEIWTDVTPDLALKWLEQCNPVNRGISDKTVKRYVKDMHDGHWRGDSPQGLIFAGDPFKDRATARLLDGQHRMWAVVESQTTQRFHIALNAPASVMAVLDDGLKRTDAEIYRVTHPDDEVKGTKRHTSIARALMSERRDWTRTDILAMLERHAEHIVMVSRWLDTGAKKMRGFAHAKTGAALVRASYHADRDALERFVRVLASGMPEELPKDNPIILLRNLMLGTTTTKHATVDTLYWKTERALKAYLSGEPVKMLYAVDGEQFPLPEEQPEQLKRAMKAARKTAKKGS